MKEHNPTPEANLIAYGQRQRSPPERVTLKYTGKKQAGSPDFVR